MSLADTRLFDTGARRVGADLALPIRNTSVGRCPPRPNRHNLVPSPGYSLGTSTTGRYQKVGAPPTLTDPTTELPRFSLSGVTLTSTVDFNSSVSNASIVPNVDHWGYFPWGKVVSGPWRLGDFPGHSWICWGLPRGHFVDAKRPPDTTILQRGCGNGI